MKQFVKKQWPALIAWIVIVAIALFAMPNVSQLVRDKGAVQLPREAESQVADRIQKKANGKAVRTYTAVFSNGKDKMTDAQGAAIDRTLKKVKADKSLHVTNIMGPNDNAETKKQLIAKDKTTMLAQITVKQGPTVKSQVKALKAKINTNGLTSYVTGADALNDDFATVAERGIQKTEVIAIIFIFVVLIIVFRSPVVPVISLLNVGVAFLTSLSVVMNLAQHFNFPISNFTEVFLVVVLFGIGTDYNILLYDYFKGGLADGLSPVEAMRQTRKHGGRTVLYSGLSVLIGFSVLWLAKFSFYQSASAVAIGVLVLLPVLLSLNMFFMATLGTKFFWPSKVETGSSSSKIWHGLSLAALKQPALMLAVVAIIAIPFGLTLNHQLNFDNSTEIPSSYQSKAGYNVIQDHFSQGMTAPMTVYLQDDKKLTTQEKLAAIDSLTQYLQKEKGVKSVMSVTEPGGKKIDAMYLGQQLKTITDGLTSSQAGLTKIQKGLDSANKQLKAANISGSVSQVKQLANGTSQLQQGANQLTSGLNTYTSGVASANSAAQQLASGASAANKGAQSAVSGTQRLASGANRVASGSRSVASGATSLRSGANQVNAGTGNLAGQLPALATGMNTLASSSGQLTSGMQQLNAQVGALQSQAQQLLAVMQRSGMNSTAAAGQLQQLQRAVGALSQGSSALSSGISRANSQMPALGSGVSQLHRGTASLASGAGTLTSGANQVANGAGSLASGVGTLASGSSQLANGTAQLANGAGQLAGGTSKLAANSGQLNSGATSLASGSSQVNAGVQQMSTQLAAMAKKVSTLQSGLGDASDGLKVLEQGNQSMHTYLSELEKSYMGKDFYLPKAMISSSAFKPAIDAYTADHGKIATLTVIFKGNPNSAKTNGRYETLKADVNAQTKHGALKHATVAFGGQTAQNNDIRGLANSDFFRTASIMVIGIAIALMFVTRSLIQPITILSTLVAAYATALGLTRLFTQHILGVSLLSWNTPFFSFIMLMALGVDYSIFLMVRFRDSVDEPDIKKRMLKAATAIGAVVISAAVILGGTFAAMIPSGVTTLIQVALTVIIGIVLLVIFLPLTLSAMISLTENQQRSSHESTSENSKN